MTLQISTSLLQAVGLEVVFLAVFALTIVKTEARSTVKRATGWITLCGTTYTIEWLMVQTCRVVERPHWAAISTALLWIQFMSASDLAIVSRVDASQLCPADAQSPINQEHAGEPLKASKSAIGLLWNLRRVNTRWQVKKTPSTAELQKQSRISFVLGRVAITLAIYLFVDAIISLPPPDLAMVQADKATLFSLHTLSLDDAIFRTVTTISYWLSTAIVNLFMINTAAIVSVLLGLSKPADCPPLYGSVFESYTVRRFWGVTWHQTFRSFLTGHADLVVSKALPSLPRHSLSSRYVRLTIAFVISALIHYRSDQVIGIPDAENGAMIFFPLQVVGIMVEDAISSMTSKALPVSMRRILGWTWTLGFLVWTTPIWVYPNTRLGINSALLLPFRIVGPWMSQPKAS